MPFAVVPVGPCTLAWHSELFNMPALHTCHLSSLLCPPTQVPQYTEHHMRLAVAQACLCLRDRLPHGGQELSRATGTSSAPTASQSAVLPPPSTCSLTGSSEGTTTFNQVLEITSTCVRSQCESVCPRAQTQEAEASRMRCTPFLTGV